MVINIKELKTLEIFYGREDEVENLLANKQPITVKYKNLIDLLFSQSSISKTWFEYLDDDWGTFTANDLIVVTKYSKLNDYYTTLLLTKDSVYMLEGNLEIWDKFQELIYSIYNKLV